jgi:hypothetical protein
MIRAARSRFTSLHHRICFFVFFVSLWFAPSVRRGEVEACFEPPATDAPKSAVATTPIVDEPAPRIESAPPPVYLFLDGGKFEAIWNKLQTPDFVILKGSEYQNLLNQLLKPKPTDEAPEAIVESVDVRGTIRGDQAELTIDYGVRVESTNPVWAAIGLDDRTITDATEGDRDLPLRNQPSRIASATTTVEGGATRSSKSTGWLMRMAGRGEHRARVRLLAPIKPTADGDRLELAIPEAATTRITLIVPGKVVDATTGTREIAREPIDQGVSTRLSASLTPRSRIELTWRVEADSTAQLSPLLFVEGKIEVEVDTQSLKSKSAWMIRSERGAARRLEIGVDPADELLSILIDDQPIPTEGRRSNDGSKILIPLSEPIRPGSPRRLELTVRRGKTAETANEGSFRTTFHGFPFASTIAQSGTIAFVPRGDQWITASPLNGARRIDPRLDVQEDAGESNSTRVSFRFADQPFDISLRVDPATPWIRVESRTAIEVDTASARLETWLNYQITRGRVFEARIGLPRGLDLESVGPDDVVEQSQWYPETAGASPPDLNSTPRILVIRPTPAARARGAFRIHLIGREKRPAEGEAIALFTPRDVASAGGRIVVFSRSPSLSIESAAGDGDEKTADFRASPAELKTDWIVSDFERFPLSGRRGVLWLGYEGTPSSLPLRTTIKPRSIHHETTIKAVVDRRHVDIRQETTCLVNHGVLTHLDIAIPPAIEGLWDVDGVDVAERTPIRFEENGAHRFRLTLSHDATDSIRLRFRFRTALDPALGSTARRIEIPWIRVFEGSSSPPRLEISADPGIDLKADGSSWTRSAGDESNPATTTDDGAPPIRLALLGATVDPASATINAAANPLYPLPKVVVSRLWINTILSNDNELIGTAWYRVETHESSLSIELPRGGTCERGWVGGRQLTSIERLPGGASDPPRFRLSVPSNAATTPLLVGFDFRVPAQSAAIPWRAPKLLDEGVVQHTFWTIRVPRGLRLIGTPAGWTDENRRIWRKFGFVRVPLRDDAELAEWAAGSTLRIKSDYINESNSQPGRQTYLFSREGAPEPFDPMIPRSWLLVLGCSGTTLSLGLLLLAFRPPTRYTIRAGVVAAFIFSLLIDPDAAIAVAQSSLLGAGLIVVAWTTQLAIDRRGRGSMRFAPSSTSHPKGSSIVADSYPGADDSTEIRPRPGTTVDRSPDEVAVARSESVGNPGVGS